jgi:putative exporter of polyketide antibiotics
MFPQLPSSVDLYLKLENTQTTGIVMTHVTGMFPQLPSSVDLYLKLENTQTTGIVMTHVTGMFNGICGAMVSVLASDGVDHGFEP